MPIYTKKGDQGETGLYDLTRISKASQRVSVLGSVDELNSLLGVIRSQIEDLRLDREILKIQRNLFIIGSKLAGAKLNFSQSKTRNLEQQIDRWEAALPKLKNFLLPTGSPRGALLFFARTLARRAEREIVSLSRKEKVSPEILRFINRLSDYLYVLARYINFLDKAKEEIWGTPRK